jgi:FAD-dependent urate hydroxylase
MTTTRTALVIGAGIAGPVAAMALRKAGIQPTVYEAHPSSAEGIGGFLTIASNGIDALRAIGADETALAAGFPTPTIMLRSTTGKNLGGARTGLTLPDGTTSHTLKRTDLYRALYQEAARWGIDIQHGKRLTAAEQTSDGVHAVFEDGSDAVGDVLIGADGIRSTVRKLIDPTAPAPTYIGLINLGGYTRGVEVDAEPGSYTMIFGKRAFFGYVLAPSGEVWWFANVPRRDEPARGEAEAITPAQWQIRLTELYAADTGPAARLVQASGTAGISKASPIHSIPHLPAWHKDRMIVIGDAAHAPTPSSGQGASLSIEDAVVLAQCLRDLPTPQHAFARFEALRRARAERIIKQAARINSSKTATPITRMLRDATLPVIMKMAASSKQATAAYRYHIDWDTPIITQDRPVQRHAARDRATARAGESGGPQ